jgi:hypothetical protein
MGDNSGTRPIYQTANAILGGDTADPDDNMVIIPRSMYDPEALVADAWLWSYKRMIFFAQPHGLINRAVDSLFRFNPCSVGAWAAMLNAAPRRFQRQFKLFSAYQPKQALAMYHAFKSALATIAPVASATGRVVPAYIVDEHDKERLLEYVVTHRSALLHN